jgi:hypothetical protein
MNAPNPAPDVDELLRRWVRDGLLTGEQAGRIRAHEADQPDRAPRPGRTTSLVTEGLGYVGGVLVMVAAVIIAGRYWDGLATAGRIGLVFAAAVLLVVTGAVLAAPAGSVGHRLRAVSWLLAVVATGGWVALLAEEAFGDDGQLVALCAGAGASLLAGTLWWRHRTVLQQAAFVGAVALVIGPAASMLPASEDEVVGLALWGWGVVWLLLGAGRVVPGGTAGRATADVCGATVVVLGSLFSLGTDLGSALALASAVALVAAGVVTHDLVLLGAGAVATLVLVPSVVIRWFPDTVVAPLALLAVGAVLMVGALVVARRRRAGTRPDVTGDRSPGPRVAALTAATVALAVAGVVISLGLS